MKKFFSFLVAILFYSISVSAQSLKGDMNDDGLLTIEDIVLTTNEVLNFKEGVAKIPTSISPPLTKKYHVGDTITPTFTIIPSDAPVVYTWYKTDTKNASLTNSNKIDGATSSTYTLTDADVDKYIHFKAEVVSNNTYIGSSATMTTANPVQKPAPKIYYGMADKTLETANVVDGVFSLPIGSKQTDSKTFEFSKDSCFDSVAYKRAYSWYVVVPSGSVVNFDFGLGYETYPKSDYKYVENGKYFDVYVNISGTAFSDEVIKIKIN